MRHRQVLLAITLAFFLVWLGSNTVAQGNQAVQPITAAEPYAPAAITSTVYLPLIAKPMPTIPYVLTKIKLPAGSHPHGIALDVDQQRAFVGNHNGNSLSVINTAAMIVSTTIPLPSATGPNGVAYHIGTDRVLVANRDTNNLSVIDPTVGTWLSNVSVGQSPNGVLAHGDLIYVANFGSHSVSTLNAQTLIVTQTYLFSPASEPAMLAAHSDIDLVYLTSHGDNRLYAIQSGSIVEYSGVTAPYGVAFDGITNQIYIANRGDVHTVMTIDGGSQYGWLDVGQEPYVVGVSTRTGHVFVVLGDRVAVYDRRDKALITTIPVGTGAEEGIAIDQSRGLVYVTSGDTDEVTVIQDIATLDLAYVTYRLSANQIPQSDIFISDDTGQHVNQLTHATGDLELNAQPAFQPGGKHLAFVSSRDDVDHNWNVFTMELTGHNQVDLTIKDGGVEDTEPAWSPDGTQIAWRRDWSIWVMNADGSNKQQLTFSLPARSPQWSPDGQWISFVAFANGGHEDVFVIPAAGGMPINLTDNPAADLQPSWSADSQALAFETNRHHVISGTTVITDNWELYAVNISTTVQTRLTDSPGQDHAASWSPDGSQIAFISDRNNAQYDFSLWVMNPDGTQQRRVTGPMQLLAPIAWSPDGRRVAIQGGLLENGELYAIDVASGAVARLTNDSVGDANPVWRPDTWR
jgi:YVTN family beta-propeller protein